MVKPLIEAIRRQSDEEPENLSFVSSLFLPIHDFNIHGKFSTPLTMKKKAGTYCALVFFLFFTAGCATLDIVKDRIDSPVVGAGGPVVFYFDSTSARSVSVAGDFNGWEYRPEQPRAVIMKKNEAGVWQAAAEVPPGRYQYKIVVDYQTWITDPYNTNTIDDGTGNINSLLVVK